MEGTETDEAKPHYNDLGKPASFECTRCMRTQGLDRFQWTQKLALTGSLLAWVQRSKVQRLKELNTFLLIFFTYLSSAMFLQNHHSQKKHDIALWKAMGHEGTKKDKATKQNHLSPASRHTMGDKGTQGETKQNHLSQTLCLSWKLFPNIYKGSIM